MKQVEIWGDFKIQPNLKDWSEMPKQGGVFKIVSWGSNSLLELLE